MDDYLWVGCEASKRVEVRNITAMYIHCRLTSAGCMVLMQQHKLLCSFAFPPLHKMAIFTPRNILVHQGIILTYFVNIYKKRSISAKMPDGNQAGDPTLGLSLGLNSLGTITSRPSTCQTN